MSKTRHPILARGIFCISIDLELFWGRKNLPNSSYYKKLVKEEPKVIDSILEIFNKYNIHATWATVGKVLEKNLRIINSIRKVGGQEIGGHTYSHKVFAKISRAEAEKELKLQKNIFNKNKIEIASFVFPQNKIKYLNILPKYGIKQYRGKDLHEHELIYPKSPPVFTPKRVNKCTNVAGSMYFVSTRGIRKFIPPGLRYFKSILGINKAIKEKKIFHLWFHPTDLTLNSKRLLKELEMISAYAKEKSDTAKLDLKNMQEIGLLANLDN